MMCEYARELIAASWLRELDEAGERALRLHLEDCGECRAEMASLGAVWERLGDVPAPEPGRALDLRWQATLESLTRDAVPRPWRFWPRTPAWQGGLVFASLLAGLAAGLFVPRHDGEIVQLRREIESTRAMVALSLLQQQSPSERLRGIDYSGHMARLEPDVITALIQAVDNDPSTNVRLAAIDALGKAAGSRDVLRSLTRSLPEQDSPMVQAALIDYLVDARDRQATDALREFARQPNLNPAVLDRAHSALAELASH